MAIPVAHADDRSGHAHSGGLIFTGDLNGVFLALDATNGRIVWREEMGHPMGGGVISYSAGGMLRIAVAAAMKSRVWPVESGPARVVVYGLR